MTTCFMTFCRQLQTLKSLHGCPNKHIMSFTSSFVSFTSLKIVFPLKNTIFCVVHTRKIDMTLSCSGYGRHLIEIYGSFSCVQSNHQVPSRKWSCFFFCKLRLILRCQIFLFIKNQGRASARDFPHFST